MLRLLADGLTCAEIAAEMSYSTHTVKGMRAVLLRKLGARNAPHAVKIGFERGLLEREKLRVLLVSA